MALPLEHQSLELVLDMIMVVTLKQMGYQHILILWGFTLKLPELGNYTGFMQQLTPMLRTISIFACNFRRGA